MPLTDFTCIESSVISQPLPAWLRTMQVSHVVRLEVTMPHAKHAKPKLLLDDGTPRLPNGEYDDEQLSDVVLRLYK